MAGDAYFRLKACYKKENFETRQEEPQEICKKVKDAIAFEYSERVGYETSPLDTHDSVKWRGMYDDMQIVSARFPDLVIEIEKQLNDTDLFDDDNDTFTRFAFCNGAVAKSKAHVVYQKYSDFKNI